MSASKTETKHKKRETHIVEQTLLSSRISTRKLHSVAGLAIAVPADLELRARREELGAALPHGVLEPDDLVTDEILPRRETGWDLGGGWLAVLCREGLMSTLNERRDVTGTTY